MVSTPGVDATLETGDEVAEEALAPDPIQTLKVGLEARLDASADALHNQIGYLGRRVETALSQSVTAETKAEVASLRQQIEDLSLNLRLRDMEPEERAAYLLEERKVKPKETAPASDTTTLPDPDTVAQMEYQPWGLLLKEEAETESLNFEAVTRRSDWPKQVTSWPAFYRAAQHSIANAADEARKAAVPPPRTDTQRGGGTPASKTRFTRDEIARMSPEDYAVNKDAIWAALARR